MTVKVRIALALAVIAATATTTYWSLGRYRADADALVLYGNVDIREVELAFRQPGRVASMAVDEGAAVRKGDVLAELDTRPLQDAVAIAQAEVLRAKAEADKVRAGNRAQEVAQAQDAVSQAQAAAVQADAEFARQTALLAIGGTSQKAVDAGRSVRDQAQAQLSSARQAFSLRKEGSRKEDIAAAEARVAAATATLAQAQTALADSRLLAPADAIVTTRAREPGSMVTANAPVYTLSLQDPVYIRAYVSETQLARVAPGAPVTVVADGASQAFKGVVGFVSPRSEFTPKSVETADLRTDLVYRLRIVVADGGKALRQGMPVTVRLADVATKS